MSLFHFWKSNPPLLPPARTFTKGMEFLIEQEGSARATPIAEAEKLLGFKYAPQLDFEKWGYFDQLARKTQKYHAKGLLDIEQLWLGTYYQQEILRAAMPAVRLRWIDERVGWGVFAERDLKPMEYIGEYAGLIRCSKRSDFKNAYCFEYVIVKGEKTRYTIDARDQGGIVRFINHSAKPNLMSALATVQSLCHVILFVYRPIKKGEQLCYDYGQDYWKKRTSPVEF